MSNLTDSKDKSKTDKSKVQKIYNLSPMQEGMLFYSILEEKSSAYYQQLAFSIEGELNVELLEKSVNLIIKKYDILRTNFVHQKVKKPQQVVFKERNIKAYYEDLSAVNDNDKNKLVEAYLIAEKEKGFNLLKDSLIKLSVIKTHNNIYRVIISNHHIILDGWSIGIITKEILEAYKMLEENKPVEFIEKQPYNTYINWLKKYDTEVALNYWKKHLDSYEQKTSVPRLYRNNESGEYDNKELYFSFNKELTKGLENLARENHVTLNIVFQAIWGILLQKYNNVDDSVFGSIVSGRPAEIPNVETMVGLFINVVPVRVKSEKEQSFSELVKQLHKQALASKQYEYSPLAEVQALTPLKQDLLDNIIEFENYPIEKSVEFAGNASNKVYDAKLYMQSNYDLNISVIPGEELGIRILYNGLVYSRELMENIEKHLTEIISKVIINQNIAVKDIEIISEKEKSQILFDFNNTDSDFPYDKTLQEIFEEQVEKSPEAVAVVYEDEKLTYSDLNKKANQLAGLLREKQVTSNSLVGLLFKRSLEMIVSILGVLKSGGAYLPIDPEYPIDRINGILSDSDTNIVLTDDSKDVTDKIKDLLSSEEQNDKLEIITYSNILKDLDNYSEDNPEKINNSQDLAYVIYTSGSTGKPKGNLITHYNVSRVVKNTNYIDINQNDILLQLSNYAFDGSTFDIYGALLNSAKLVMVNKDILLDISILSELIKNEGITLFFVTTALFNALVDVNIDTFKSIRKVLFGGERVSVKHVEKALEYMGKGKIIHVYGPTESTVYATYYNVDSIDERLGTIPIGGPLANTKIYVLDKNNMLQPVGAAGELCVAGKGLAKGYLNRPELTSEKFISSPFEDGELIYKTGDLTRWLSGGFIEFLDRVDSQVKLRGFRIELGEIETQLLEINNIKEAVVLCRQDKDAMKYLCAYIVADKELSVNEIRSSLEKELPDYMIPSYFTQLDSIPLTLNGKVDKKALEGYGAMDSGIEYTAPRNDIEATLVQAWQDILGVKGIGINENYFSLGGDSIKAIQVASRLQKQNLKMEIKDLFKHPTISGLSPYIKTADKKIEQVVVKGQLALTPIQKWFFEKQFTDMNHFNHSVMLYNKNGFDEKILEKVFTNLLEHHDALRMTYKMEDNKVVQFNRGIEGRLFELEVVNLLDQSDCESKILEEANKVQSSIDINAGPLLKLRLFKTSKGDNLLIVIHHLVIDGVSWRIILEDLTTAYIHAAKGQSIRLQDKSNSFMEWSKKLNDYTLSEKLEEESKYWEKLLSNEILPLPKDSKALENRIKNSSNITITLTENETSKLLRDVNFAYNTEINHILLSALGTAFKKWCGIEKFLINMEGHGREDIIDGIDINRTVGWFTTAYPVVLNMEKSQDVSYSIKRVKDDLNRIPNNGIGYGLLEYIYPEKSKLSVDFNNKAEISFNYLGQFDQDIKTEVFEISEYSTGNTVSPEMERSFTFDINGLIKDKKLELTFNYNNSEYKKETVNNLAQLYKNSIISVIEHCSVKELTEYTPTDFMYNRLSLEDFENIKLQLNNKEIENIYSLTPMQEGMLFNSLVDKKSHAYFEQLSFDLHNEVNAEHLEKSLNIIIDRHEILRMVFNHEKAERPIQIVLKERYSKALYEDVSHMDKEDMIDYIETFKFNEKEKGFKLTEDVLIKLAIFKLDVMTYKLVFSFHHILMDGWCIGIIIKEFFQILESLQQSKSVKLGEVYPYSNYISWLEKQNKKEAREYWKKYLEHYQQLATLPKREKLIKVDKYNQKHFAFKIDENLTKGISSIAQKNNVTFSTVFQTIWGMLLKRYNSINDVVFGAVVSGRPHEVEGVDRIVGLFINTIPVRVKFGEDKAFNEVIKDLQLSSLESEKYDYFPLAQIQGDTDLKQALLDHIIVFENYPLEDEISRSKDNDDNTQYKIDNVDVFEQTNYDFNIIVMPGNEVTIKLMYNDDIYDESFIRKVEGHFIEVIKAVIENPQLNTNSFNILTNKEEKEIVVDFNKTEAVYPNDKTLNQLFEEQVKNTPDNIALTFDDESLTYRELNEKSNQLARKLRENGVKEESVVAIMLERSFEMIIGIMAILKAGGAYLPIDPSYPIDRVLFMLDDSQADIVLVNNNRLILEDRKEIKVIDLHDKQLYSGDSSNLKSINTARSLAYIIYTSGSTGKPKGVLIEHSNVINIVTDLHRKYPLNETDVFLLKTTYTFDVSVAEIFGWFHQNGRLSILEPEGEKYPESIIRAIHKDKVTHINFVPSMFNALIDSMKNDDVDAVSSLKYIFVAGEAISSEVVKKFYSKIKGVKLENIYGPTEATIYATGCSLDGTETSANMPIGYPMQNTKVFVVDGNKLQPVGVPGELCISGDGLSRGYLNRLEITKEKFVPNPFVLNNPNYEKMYRTGDLVRWLSDGRIEFLGRIDYQVKVRGFRIELGEIEMQLLKLENIKEALVMVRDNANGDKYLCAYVTSDEEVDVVELKKYLSNNLPDYMIPSFFIQLDAIPLTSSGKADRKVLPEPDKDVYMGEEYVEPSNEIELTMVNVWKEVLGIEKLGIRDSFLDLGGDSIEAIQVAARLSRHNMKLEIKDIFQYKTIEEISKAVVKVGIGEIKQEDISGEVLLTPIQRWFFEMNFVNMDNWNQAVVLKAKNKFDLTIIEKVFDKIVKHHDALRMVYKVEGEKIVQYNRNTDNEELFTLKSFDLTNDINYKNTIQMKCNELQSSINLEKGPLVKLGLFKTKEADYLLIAIHHLVIDGVSWRIIFEDFVTAYSQIQNDEQIVLQDKTHSYKQWALKINEYSQQKEVLLEKNYWSNIEEKQVPLLPTDKQIINKSKVKNDKTLDISLTQEYTQKLLTEANKAYNTEINDLLLTALGITIKDWANQDRILINLEGHGREEIVKGMDITRTVGWFTSLYPVLIEMNESKDISYLIRTTKEGLRKIPNKGIGYGVLRYLTTDIRDNNVLKNNPEICFNYLGQMGQDMDTELFNLSDINPGHMASPESESLYKFNINAVITEGKLMIVCIYNGLQYNAETIEFILESYRKNLNEIIQHCISKFSESKEAELTPSDLGDKDLSMEDLEYMSDFLESL